MLFRLRSPVSRCVIGILSLLCLLGLHRNAAGSDYHVAKTGNDNHPGSQASPFLTISRAAEAAQPGDTVLVHEGVYRERVAPPRGGEPGNRIVYTAAPGERVVIKGSEVWEPQWTKQSAGLFYAEPASALFNDLKDEYVDGRNPLEVQLASTPWQREGRRERERGFHGDDRIVFTCGQVFVDGRQLLEVPLKEELQAGCWFYERESKRVYVDFGDSQPHDHLVELTTRRRIFAPAIRGLGYITVQGFIMEHCGNQYPTNFWESNANAQKGALGTEAGHHWIIRRNLIRHAKTFGVDAGYVDKRTRRIIPESNLIEQNYIVDNGSAGILSNGSRKLIVRDNVILRNNTLHFLGLKRWEQAGIKCHGFREGLIEHNYVADNALTYGIWLDNQFPDSRVTRNVLVNNGRAGIFLEMSDYEFDRLLVDNNVIVGNAENPVYIHDASGATFVHNLLANAQTDREYGQAVFIRQVSARTKTYHHTFHNNLMLGTECVVDVNYPAHRSGPQRFDYNVYGVEPMARAFRLNRASDKPWPWEADQFAALVGKEIDVSFPAPEEGDRNVPLSFTEWQRFWRWHKQENDRHSVLNSGTTASYDAADQVLTLQVPSEIGSLATTPHDVATHDFYGKPIAETRQPGPFQEMKPGKNVFDVWNGLPLLAPGELPPRRWNEAIASESSVGGTSVDVRSPDDRIHVRFEIADFGARQAVPSYRVDRDGEPIIDVSQLGLVFSSEPHGLDRFSVADVSESAHDSTWQPLHGERKSVRDQYRELTVRLRQEHCSERQLEFVFRCYDAGVAIRYRVHDAAGAVEVAEERTQFRFHGDQTIWAASSAQGEHRKLRLSELSGVCERPLSLQISPTCYVAITEAGLDNYSSMMLKLSDPERPYQLGSHLLGPVRGKGQLESPWRVIMIADSAAKLLEQNDIIRNLNRPCEIPETSWIKPGKVLREMTLTTAGALKAIDFAAEHNLQYIEFDAGWYGHEWDREADARSVTLDPKRSNGPFDLKRLIKYATEKGLGVILYVNRNALERQLDEVLPLYKSWGVAGVKFGFVKTGSQAENSWLHSAIRQAAQHELMVDVHDTYRSTGYQRTYPNLMTMEGIGGDETQPTNELALVNLFTRMLGGRADHTFCYFDDRIGTSPTHAAQLAKPILFFSPWQFLFWYDQAIVRHVTDDRRLRNSPELEFWDRMPTVWDDTRVLAGSIGEFASIARRHGDEWFVGVLTNDRKRTLELTIDFLNPEKSYVAHRYYDDPDAGSSTSVGIRQERISGVSTLRVQLLANGGEAIRIVPER